MKIIKSLTFLIIAINLTSCAYNEINSLDKSVRDLRSITTDNSSQLDSLSSEIRELRAKVDELAHAQKKKYGADVDSLKNEITNLRRRVPPPAIVPAAQLESDEALATSIGGEIGERFGQALGFIRDGIYEQAIPLLQSALDANTTEKQSSANILFWLGTSYDGLNDHRNAMLAYNQIVSVFPDHPLVPKALLRQGTVLTKIGDKGTAEIIFKKLIADFKDSDEAAEASQKLKTLK